MSIAAMHASAYQRKRRADAVARQADPALIEAGRQKKREWARAWYRRNRTMALAPQKRRKGRLRIRKCVLELLPLIHRSRRRAPIETPHGASVISLRTPTLRLPKPPRFTEAELEARRRVRARLKNQRKNARRVGAKGRIRPADIDWMMRAQRGRCFYCCGKLGKDFHIDHFTPLSRGGSNERDNLRLACPDCNIAKSDKPAAEFLGVLVI